MNVLRRRRLLGSAAVLGIGWLAASSPALAQTAAPAQSTGQAGAAASATLGEIVVTAERRSTVLKDTPISISVMAGAKLDKSTTTGLTDILNTVPGVAATVDYQSGGTQLSIRGVSAAGPLFVGAGTVAYYLDSMPFGFVRSSVGPDLNPYDLSRVEILRGPQGTLYGAGGLNGVVRVLTNDPDLANFDAKARVNLSGTQHGGANYGGDAEVNIPIIKDKLGVRVVVGDNHWSGWIDSLNKKDANDADLRNYRVKVEARPTEQLDAIFSFWRTDNKYGAPSSGNGAYFSNAALPEPMTSVYNGYGLKLSYELPAFTVTSQTSYLDYTSTAFTDLHRVGLPAGFRGNTNLSSKVFSEEFDLSSKAGGPFKWSAGAFYRDAEDKVFQPLYTPTARPIFDNFSDKSKSWAVYGEIGQKFAQDTLEWTLGLRYFQDAGVSQALSPSALGPVSLAPFKADFHALTPRAVLQWYPTPRQSFYLSYSQGFRSGVVQDEEVTVVSPNIPPARPDRLNNYEVGYKSTLLGGRLDLEAAVFYIDWQRVQQVVQIPVSAGIFAGAIVNGASASGVGAEGSITGRVTDQLTVSAHVSWNGLSQDEDVFSSNRLLFLEGQRLNYSPAYTAGASADYRFPLGDTGFRATLSGALNFTSHQLETTLRGASRVVLPGDDLYDLSTRLAVDSPDRKWTATVFANNLTNNNARVVRSASTLLTGFFDTRVRPRTVGMQLDYHY